MTSLNSEAQAVLARLMKRSFTRPNGCIEWTGQKNWSGYGKVYYQGKNWFVHRLLLTLFHGPIPNGYVPDHLCGNRLCMNPTHMELVTSQVNTLRGKAAQVGKRNPRRLPFSEIQEIRRLHYVDDVPYSELSHKFKIPLNSISEIVNFKRRAVK